MSSIYLTSTYYHVLISCVKQLIEKRRDCDIAITSYISCGEYLTQRLKDSGLFRRAFYTGDISEYVPKSRLDYIFNQHRKNAAHIESQGFSLSGYEDISIYHDDTWFAHYIKDKRLPYHLIEDALDIYKFIENTKFVYMVPHKSLKLTLKSITRIGYMPLFCDPCMITAEVNEINGISFAGFAGNRLKEIPRHTLFSALTDNDKAALCHIFLPHGIPEISEDSVLMITQPLFEDGVVDSMEEQINVYKSLIQQYASSKSVVIKPHPRDNGDYSRISTDTVILDKNLPVEILTICLQGRFDKAITMFSSAISAIEANEKIIIRPDLFK